MKIIALGDIHNAFETAYGILKSEQDIDVILICGDITTHGSPGEAKRAIDKFREFGKPLLAVAGNMDSGEIDRILIKSGCSINGMGVILNDVGFFGVSGAPLSPLNTPYEIPEDRIFQFAEAGYNDVLNAKWKVFVPHAPPYCTKLDLAQTGAHVGSISVRKFIEERQPDISICGHIHEARGTDILGMTKVINCGKAADGYYSIIEAGKTIQMENRG
jgi:uncharacterized protein